MKPQQIGPYSVRVETESYFVYVKDKNDKTIPIRKFNQYLRIAKDPNDPNPRTFKRYLHRGQFYWRDLWWDERICPVEVTERVAKILYAGNYVAAERLVSQIA